MLWLLADEGLIDQLGKGRLGALDALSKPRRDRLTGTFGTWLETWGAAAEMAGRLCVHPRTVRYRMRKLERTLGGRLGDPGARFAMEPVLRATRLRERGSQPGSGGPTATEAS